MTRLTRNGDPRAAQTVKAQLQLRRMIYEGELRAGERVPELMLVERTGVSRTPIRAALMHLAEEGLLEPSGSGGFVVRAFDEEEVNDAIDVRGILEGAAARRAAQRRPSPEDLAELRDCVGAMDAAVNHRAFGAEQLSDFVRLNERYHSLLLGLARSSVLSRAIERIAAVPFASPSAFVVSQSALADTHQTLKISQRQHRAILEAVAAGAGARAEKLTREHSNLAKRSLREAAQSEGPSRRKSGANFLRLVAV